MKSILVTGAHGTLGHVVCRVLAQKHGGITVPGWDEMLDGLCGTLEDETQSRPGRGAARWATGASP